jgi:hypothetical protein
MGLGKPTIEPEETTADIDDLELVAKNSRCSQRRVKNVIHLVNSP